MMIRVNRVSVKYVDGTVDDIDVSLLVMNGDKLISTLRDWMDRENTTNASRPKIYALEGFQAAASISSGIERIKKPVGDKD